MISCCSLGEVEACSLEVLCYGREKCPGQTMAQQLQEMGAVAMLLVSEKQLLADMDDEAQAFDLPAISISESFVKDIPSWLGNKD